jgi:hypothetical protein
VQEALWMVSIIPNFKRQNMYIYEKTYRDANRNEMADFFIGVMKKATADPA